MYQCGMMYVVLSDSRLFSGVLGPATFHETSFKVGGEQWAPSVACTVLILYHETKDPLQVRFPVYAADMSPSEHRQQFVSG